MAYKSAKYSPIFDRWRLIGTFSLFSKNFMNSDSSLYIPNVAEWEGGLGSRVYTHTILSSAPEAKNLPFGEKRTA